MNTRIVITGMGAVTPVGNNVEQYWQGLLSGACGIAPITRSDVDTLPIKVAAQVHDFQPKKVLTARQAMDLDTFMQFAYVAGQQALADSGLLTKSTRVGVVMGTALAGLTLTGETQQEIDLEGKHVSPRFLTKIMGNIVAAQFAIEHGIKGPSLTVSTACSSGGDAICLASLLLQAGQADAVVVLAGESAISPLLIHSLVRAGALSKTGRSCPFDASRDGFVVGEGGGALILETQAHAQQRNAKIYAELLGCANNTDAFHPVSPDPTGNGAAGCMRIALEQAGCKPEQIDYVNAHGTATIKGDLAEAAALHHVFGDYEVPVSSTKGATGHMMGAGGITETIACIKAIETGLLPPTLHCDTPDEACGLNVVTNKPVAHPVRIAMSNALGFGGQNSCVIVGSYSE